MINTSSNVWLWTVTEKRSSYIDLESGEFRGIWSSERNHCFKCSPVHSKVGQLLLQLIFILPALQFMKILNRYDSS